MHPGDYAVFYTNGLTEAMNEAEETYGFDRMIQHILHDIHGFMGAGLALSKSSQKR